MSLDFSELKQLNIDDIKLEQLYINDVRVWKTYKNWVRYSTEADGVTIYNGGLGYKNGYRVRSGGAEDKKSTGSCTGYIPVSAGDVVRLSGYDVKYQDNVNAINVSNATYTNIGQISANYFYGCFEDQSQTWDDVILEKTGVYFWIVPNGYDIAYIRVTGYAGNDGSKMIVTINEEI